MHNSQSLTLKWTILNNILTIPMESLGLYVERLFSSYAKHTVVWDSPAST